MQPLPDTKSYVYVVYEKSELKKYCDGQTVAVSAQSYDGTVVALNDQTASPCIIDVDIL